MFSSDPKHLIKTSSAKGKLPKTEIRRRTLDPRWSSKTCQLTVSDPVALRHSHVCLIVMNREQGVKDEILGVANFSLAEATWVNSQRPAPAPAATGRPAARQSSIASSRSGLQSSPALARGPGPVAPENRTLFATVGDIYCDAEGDADDFDDTGIDFDGVDLEEEDADVGAARGSVEEIPAFDLLLVRNGLPRGRIRGRCSLLLGPEKDGGGGEFLGGERGFRRRGHRDDIGCWWAGRRVWRGGRRRTESQTGAVRSQQGRSETPLSRAPASSPIPRLAWLLCKRGGGVNFRHKAGVQCTY
ncbi:unnamed protein product [Ascophyllum nodosum]